MLPFETVSFSASGDAVVVLDQTQLPGAVVHRELRTADEVCDAIARLVVRGAPAIGVAGAMGLVVAAASHVRDADPAFRARLDRIAARIIATRPTAANLAWAVQRVVRRAGHTAGPPANVLAAMREEAVSIRDEDRAMCAAIAGHALPLLPSGVRALTHCNAGALATAGTGTALAPVYLAAEQGREVQVFVGETRPLLQGSRLTAWELSQAGIPVTVLTDAMSPALMRSGEIDLCIVGADRIAANGDTANKIGTYAIAVAAHHHDIPFYVAAPSSSIDPAIATGDDIRIEERSAEEITGDNGRRTAPAGVAVRNPAFDVTPASLITAIVTDRGVHRPPYDFRES